MNDLVWCGFRHSGGALLLLRPQSLCPVFRPQPCIPVRSWKTLSIQRKLWRGCRPRLILQDRAWSAKDVSKRIDDGDFVRVYSFFPSPHGLRTCATSFQHMCDHMWTHHMRTHHMRTHRVRSSCPSKPPPCERPQQ